MRLLKKLLLFPLLAPALGLWAQNVGIGTSSPAQKLHVFSGGSIGAIRIESAQSTGNSVLEFAIEGKVRSHIQVDGADGYKMKIGGSDVAAGGYLTIQPDGHVGIGTSSPVYPLHVSADLPQGYVAYFENKSASGLGAYSNNTYNALGGIADNQAGIGVYGVHLPSNGVGWGVWGTSNSSDGIGVRGTVPTSGAWLGYGGYFSGGLAYVNGLYNLSDARMKTNVQPLGNALGKVMQLEGVSFQYNRQDFPEFVGEDQRTYIGFVAQQVDQVVPEVVAEKYLIGTDGKPASAQIQGDQTAIRTVKVVDYSALVPLLVEAIKAQQLEIQALEDRIRQMENED